MLAALLPGASSYADTAIDQHIADGFQPYADAVAGLVFAAIDLGGTISAEHGVGVAKVAWLSACRGDDEFRAIQAIKTGLDPSRTLNPGVLLPR